VGDGTASRDIRATIERLCDDAQDLLDRATPRYESALLLMENARALAANAEPPMDLSRVEALHARAQSLARADKPGWTGWVIPGVLAIAAAIVMFEAVAFPPSNFASDAKVQLSTKGRKGKSSGLFDGDLAKIAVVTKHERNPQVTLDFKRPREIDRVVVMRPPGDLGVISVEISYDAEVWGELTRIPGAAPVWDFKREARARYLRLTLLSPGVLRLNEVEVYSP